MKMALAVVAVAIGFAYGAKAPNWTHQLESRQMLVCGAPGAGCNEGRDCCSGVCVKATSSCQ